MLLSAPVSPALALTACYSHTTYPWALPARSLCNFNRPPVFLHPATPHFPLSSDSEELSELRPELV